MRVVIDTNILFAGLSYTSYYFPIVAGIYEKTFTMLVSTPIMLEYEEILCQEHTPLMVEYFLEFLRTSDNIIVVNPTFRFQPGGDHHLGRSAAAAASAPVWQNVEQV